MADVVIGQRLAAAWTAYVGKSPEDNIHDEYWVFNRMSKGKAFVGFDGGTSINGPIEYALNPNVEWISDYSTIATSKPDTFDEYTYNWKIVGGAVPLSTQEAAENQGSGRKFNLKAAKLDNLKSSMMSKINEALFATGTGNSGLEFGGFQHVISTSPTSGTVGGVNRATYTFWRNQATTATKTSTDFDNLRSAMRSSYNNASLGVNAQQPTWGVTTQTVFQGYEGLLIANERFTSKDEGDGSFKNQALKFKGMLLAFDRDCPSGTMYMVNENSLQLGYLNGYWMTPYPEVMPANQFVEVFKVETKANVFSKNPRRNAVISSIT